MNTKKNVLRAAVAATALAVGLTVTGCSCTTTPRATTEQWCEQDSTDELKPDWECETGMADREWEPDTDKPKSKKKPNKTQAPAGVVIKTPAKPTTPKKTTQAPRPTRR